jgi:hypothetical protein
MDFNRSLNVMENTSFLQSVQVIEDLVKPINLFSTYCSSPPLTELDKSKVFCLLTTYSKLPTKAAYNSWASCCYKLMSPCLTESISPKRC